MKLFDCALIFLLLVSCSSSRIQPKNTIELDFVTNPETEEILVGPAVNLLAIASQVFPNASIYPFEENYAMPTLESVTKDFLPYYRKRLKEEGIEEYTIQYDCEDYARFFKLEMQKVYRDHPRHFQGLSVGVLVYYVENGSHAINVLITTHQEYFAFVLIEPQTGELVSLNNFDTTAVWYVSF